MIKICFFNMILTAAMELTKEHQIKKTKHASKISNKNYMSVVSPNTHPMVWVSKISKICLLGYPTGQATF